MQVFFRHILIAAGLLLLMGTGMAQQGFMGGIGPTVETDQGLWGANGRFYYGPNPHICFGPEVSFFPYQEVDSEYEMRITELNFNGHYVFEATHKLGIYPLAGVNYTIEEERLIEMTSEQEEVKEFGLNYGFGAHYNLNHFFAFVEFKGIAGQLADQFVTVGLVFILSKSTVEPEH
ncbi:hypothetical protein [Spongiimicrobium sp. 2-473A-2-J]|uniref:hypothetical protein n=1 Tax=Eudoraea algarum TaxID=3417568 RepID=UPI003D36C266